MKTTLLPLLLFCILLSSGCTDNNGSTDPSPVNIHVKVKSLNNQPIPDATVIIESLGRYALTDSNGWAAFEDIHIGTFWVVAFRSEGDYPYYARDSILVTTRSGVSNEFTIFLSASPRFIDVTVNSMTIQQERFGDPLRKVRLKAFVEDPDGPFDIRRVGWSFQEISGTMRYNQDPDSAFWETELREEEFPDGNIGEALGNPFVFEVTDGAGSSVNTEATLTRILRQIPNVRDCVGEPQPVIHWSYEWYDDFGPDEWFGYILRIFRDDPNDHCMVYDTLFTGGEFNTIDHQVGTVLEPGDYYCYVWVIDSFGNYSRSRKGYISDVPPQ